MLLGLWDLNAICALKSTQIWYYFIRLDFRYFFFSECTVSCIVNALSLGKLGSEEDTKEEFRMEREPPATHEEGTTCLSMPVVINLVHNFTLRVPYYTYSQIFIFIRMPEQLDTLTHKINSIVLQKQAAVSLQPSTKTLRFYLPVKTCFVGSSKCFGRG